MESNYIKREAHFTFIWKIAISDPCFGIYKSPEFIVESMEMTKWYLIYKMERCQNADFADDGWAYLSIQRVDDVPKEIEIKFEFSFLAPNGSSIIKKSRSKVFRKNGQSQPLSFSKIDEIFQKERDQFCPNGVLTIRCQIWRKNTEISKFELCFASSSFCVHKYFTVWAVKRFSSLQHKEERFRILNSNTEGGPKLILSVSLAEMNGKKSVIIEVVDGLDVNKCISLFGEIALLDEKGMIAHSQRVYKVNKDCKLCVFENLELMSDGGVLLSDDVLLLQCELRLSPAFEKYNIIEDYKFLDYCDSKPVHVEKSETQIEEVNECAEVNEPEEVKESEEVNEPVEVSAPFKEIFSKFKDEGIFCDICLRADNKSFPVHKLILSIRSPVFEAMFAKVMKEKTSKCIDIPDMDVDTLNRLLLYIYEDKVQDLTKDSAVNLFVAADRYELFSLKEKCSNFLKMNITESNACDILVLTDVHRDGSLRKSVQEFILNNLEIVRSDVWKTFRDNHTKLALMITEEIIFNLKNSRF